MGSRSNIKSGDLFVDLMCAASYLEYHIARITLTKPPPRFHTRSSADKQARRMSIDEETVTALRPFDC